VKLFIVTGASKGLGEEMLRQLMRPGHRLIGLARGEGTELQAEARARGVRLEWISCDLSDARRLETVMAEALTDGSGGEGSDVGIGPGNGSAFADGITGAYLINNAGTIEPMAPVDRCSVPDMARSVALNLIAPMALTAEFIRHTAGWDVDRRVLNVSSGAGKKPYYGWSAYCASKAALDMFTRCAGEEQQVEEGGVRVLSVAPGVVDTGMQSRIRETSADLFRQRDRFVRLKQSGALLSPGEAADKLLRVLFDDRHPSGSVLDIRDLF
jgi:benzil reductase ((S)-benzoin forming)